MVVPKQTDPQFKLRITPHLKDRIKKASEANNRTMNAEIIHRLEDSFEGYALEMDFETGQPKRSPPVMSLSDYLYRAMTEEQIIDLIDRYSSELGQAAQALSEKLQDRK